MANSQPHSLKKFTAASAPAKGHLPGSRVGCLPVDPIFTNLKK
jgi:hypothetical protein